MSEQAEKGVSSYAGEVGGPAAKKSGGSVGDEIKKLRG